MTKKLFLFVFIIVAVTSSYADSGFDNVIMKHEGINSIDSSQTNLTSLVDRIIKSKDKNLPYALLQHSKEEESSNSKDIYFVLFLLASSFSGDESFAFSEYKKAKSKLQLSYMDSEVNSPEELLDFSYFWLLNNTNFTVPESLIIELPELFWDTPYWYATRDDYFNVEVENKEIKKLISSSSFKGFFSTLRGINNPGSCSVGSMYNSISKGNKIDLFTLLLRPDYFQIKTMANEDAHETSSWLDYWKHRGQFENGLYHRLDEEKESLVNEIEYFLVNIHAIDTSEARKLAKTFAQRAIFRFSGSTPSGYPEIHKMIMEHIEDGDLRIVRQLPEQFDTVAVSGMILDSNNNALIEKYYDYLIESKNSNGKNQFIELASAKNNMQGLKLLVAKGHYQFPNNDGGGFNKTPIMYAVQNDLADNYMYLKASYPEFLNYIMPSNKFNCGPEIRQRTVLTYALENATYDLIKQVGNDVDPKLIKHEDSEGRNAFYYLSQNEKLSKSDKQAVLALMLSKVDDFPIHKASFDCHKARSTIELLTCSSDRNAKSDLNLNKKYQQTKSQVSKKDVLLREQRAWLKGREACINQLGFVDCYNERISSLDKTLELKDQNAKINTPIVPDFRGVYLGYDFERINSTPSVIDDYMPGIWRPKYHKGMLRCKKQVVSNTPMSISYTDGKTTNSNITKMDVPGSTHCSTLSNSPATLKGPYALASRGISYSLLDGKLYQIELGTLAINTPNRVKHDQCKNLTEAILSKFTAEEYSLRPNLVVRDNGNFSEKVLQNDYYRIKVLMQDYIEGTIFSKRKNAYCKITLTDKILNAEADKRYKDTLSELKLKNIQKQKMSKGNKYDI